MAIKMEIKSSDAPVAHELLNPFPVSWSSVWVGALATMAVSLVTALVATAIAGRSAGARLGPEDLGMGDLIASVCGAFFSFAVGGWAATRVAGFRRAEPAMLHGAFVWLLGIPMLLALLAIGARAYFGAWYTGLVATVPATTLSGPEAAEMAREAAGGGATALLIGLIGAVLGGWLGSGEPMDPRAYRRRQA